MVDDLSERPAPSLTRRDAIAKTAAIFGTLSAGSVLATLAPSRAWALELQTLAPAQGQTLIAFAQTLYPHKGLETAVYALVAKDLDAAAKGSAKTADELKAGTAELDGAAGGSFVSASPDVRLAAVKKIEGTPFFGTVRSTCITSLYNNDMAFAHFGYEGASWPRGGYLHRGFNDLTWLPNPPDAASPPIVGER